MFQNNKPIEPFLVSFSAHLVAPYHSLRVSLTPMFLEPVRKLQQLETKLPCTKYRDPLSKPLALYMQCPLP